MNLNPARLFKLMSFITYINDKAKETKALLTKFSKHTNIQHLQHW